MKIFLIIVLVLVAVVVVALIVADQKYGAVLSSPRVGHSRYLEETTRAVLTVDPQLAKDVVAQYAQAIPAWVLPLALAHEGALIVNVDQILSDMKLTAFINDKRFGPIIRDKVNSLAMPQPFDKWLNQQMELVERGVLLRKGEASLDRSFVDMLKELWKDVKIDQPLDVKGGHMLELALDNRDGSAIAILTAVATAVRPELSTSMVTKGQVGMFTCIESVRVAADVTPANELKLNVVLECSQSNAEMIPVLKMMLDSGMGYAQPAAAAFGAPLLGEFVVQGNTVVGDYTVQNFSDLLKKLF